MSTTLFIQFLQLIRVKHWLKNGFILLPVFFAAQFSVDSLLALFPLFLSFCLVASSVYILNDLIDIKRDSLHPVKRLRPLASGYFQTSTAYLFLALFLVASVVSLFYVQPASSLVLAYFLLNIGYTFIFKYIAIVDVSVISLGFVIRVLAGGWELDIFVSQWLICIVFLLCISLAFAKRRHDLILAGDSKKQLNAINSYTVSFLDIAITISMSITLMAYIIYAISPEVAQRLGTDQLYITSFFVFLGIMRYLMLTLNSELSGTPVEIIWRDRVLQLVILCWLLTFYSLIYG
jgi:4-hydroxybenzoate polyprenyltransferase